MTLCLVTDRRRLCGGTPSVATARAALAVLFSEAVHAGVDLIQIREGDLDARALSQLTGDAVRLTRGTATRVVVNDRLDVAIASGADGVHLRGDSLAVSDVRRLAPPGFLIGRSVHTAGEASSAAGADYLVAGTVFPSVSKAAGHTLLGVAGLRSVVMATGAPVLAIGGVTPANIDEIVAAGAAGVAAIGLFLDAATSPGAMRAAVDRMHAAFDSLKPAS